ncbi:MAG: hypothetical protein H7141_12335 [Burkholderiales bacterium]|nr:hypothetical protein [Bacteroidia bacterium]
MKTIKFILIAILSFALSSAVISCKKKNTEPDTSQSQASPVQGGSNITGTWLWTSLKDSFSTGSIQTFTIPATSVITFNSTGTYTSSVTFAHIGNINNTSSDNGNYTNTDSLIITSTATKTLTTNPVRAKVLNVTTTNLSFVYKTNGRWHNCYFTKQ